MKTKLQQTIENLLKNESNFITERGIERVMSNGKNEILMSIKGLKVEAVSDVLQDEQASTAELSLDTIENVELTPTETVDNTVSVDVDTIETSNVELTPTDTVDNTQHKRKYNKKAKE